MAAKSKPSIPNRALSVRQPLAEKIRLGIKKVEYLSEMIESFRQTSETENSNVENVKLDTFTDGPDLQRKFLEEFGHLIVKK